MVHIDFLVRGYRSRSQRIIIENLLTHLSAIIGALMHEHSKWTGKRVAYMVYKYIFFEGCRWHTNLDMSVWYLSAIHLFYIDSMYYFKNLSRLNRLTLPVYKFVLFFFCQSCYCLQMVFGWIHTQNKTKIFQISCLTAFLLKGFSFK